MIKDAPFTRSKTMDPNKLSSFINKHNSYDSQQHQRITLLINGIDFYKDHIYIKRKASALEEVFSVKGDYFYIRKGQIVNITYAIGDYFRVQHYNFIGYFPINCFSLLAANSHW